MKSTTTLDYAVFQLSPQRLHCELLISSNGTTEKLASGLVKPFTSHLKIAEEQVSLAASSVKLEVEPWRHGSSWFTKGTLERFVRFVSTPEVLEMVNSIDSEMFQLEAARKIYSQGAEDWSSEDMDEIGLDTTKKELLRAIDVRLAALKQDLLTAFSRASAAGFSPDAVSGLKSFADCFGAKRLNEACTKFIALCQRRADLVSPWKSDAEDQMIRASWESDMSIDELADNNVVPRNGHDNQLLSKQGLARQDRKSQMPDAQSDLSRQPLSQPQRVPSEEKTTIQEIRKDETKKVEESHNLTSTQQSQPSRRLSVQDRINMFENKQKENSGGKPVVIGKTSELRRLSSDVSVEKTVLRRWSGASDMSIDVGNDKKEFSGADSSFCTPSSVSQLKMSTPFEDGNDCSGLSDTASSIKLESNLGQKNTGQSSSYDDKVGSTKEELNLKSKETRIPSISSKILNKPSTVTDDINSMVDEGDMMKTEGKRGAKEQQCFERKITYLESVDNGPSPPPNKNLDFRDQVSNHKSKTPVVHTSSLSGQLEVGISLKVIEPKNDQSGLETEQVRGKTATTAKSADGPALETKFQKPISAAPERTRKHSQQHSREERRSVHSTVKSGSSESSSAEPISIDQATRVRHSKGNQELNDELKIKANELEKLFAEHKLRAPGDPTVSMRRTRPIDTQPENLVSVHNSIPSSDADELSAFSTPPVKTISVPNHGSSISQSTASEDSRGKFYEKYRMKRDAKLREESGSKRAEKEAKMKTLQDTLERSRAEMKAKLFSTSGRRILPDDRQRIEKSQTANSRSSLKKEKILDSFPSNEDESFSELSEQKPYGQDKSPNDASFGDGGSRGSQVKKGIPSRNLSSANPRLGASPASRSSSKITVAGKRRGQSESPLTQSVPNFSEFRKENTKPASSASKNVNRSQLRPLGRSKGSGEEDKVRRSQALRITSDSAVDSNDALDGDDILTHSTFDKEQVDNDQFSQIESKVFLMKGNGTNASILRYKTSMEGEMLKDEDSESSHGEADDFVDAKDDDELEATEIEDGDMEIGKPMRSEKMVLSGSENGNSMRSLSHMDPSSITDMHASVPATFQASPGGSPVSWNSRNHPFSYAHEISDLDPYVDSPTGSPASWNITEMDVDAARMRKKWGNAQKPLLVGNASSNQTRKDMTKGFKRLLKFGRKSRGTENLADWISATTSEGDDDTEDGRDSGNRSSDDLRKSRMGYAHGQHLDDGYNDTELFSDQGLQSSIPVPPPNFKLRDDHMSGSSIKAPRSFFSLSSFRSKGSESKPR